MQKIYNYKDKDIPEQTGYGGFGGAAFYCPESPAIASAQTCLLGGETSGSRDISKLHKRIKKFK